MIIEDLKNIIEKNLEKKTIEVKRVFHGRGNFYDNFSYSNEITERFCK